MTASTESSTQSHHDEKEAIAPARLVAYALGNFGQSAFYNALSTYFVVYVTNSLFSGVDKAVAGKLIVSLQKLPLRSMPPNGSRRAHCRRRVLPPTAW